MRTYFLPILLSAFFLACSETEKKKTFSKKGVFFICPEGWKITDEDTIEGGGQSVTLENKDFTGSGLISINWVKDSMEMESWYTSFQESFKDNPIYSSVDLTFNKSIETKYKDYPGILGTYQFRILNVHHDGKFYLVYGKDKTVNILLQEAEEDHRENEQGFFEFKKSLKL